MMRLRLTMLLAVFLGGGCLTDMVAGDNGDPGQTPSTVGGAPIYAEDMGHAYAADPVVNGAPVKYSDIQTAFDAMGCTTTACHGGVSTANGGNVPVLIPSPTSNEALLNYYDLLSGCADGTPDSSDCIDTIGVSDSLLLGALLATSSVDHPGGKPFADETDPTYILWKGWIAAGAPY